MTEPARATAECLILMFGELNGSLNTAILRIPIEELIVPSLYWDIHNPII